MPSLRLRPAPVVSGVLAALLLAVALGAGAAAPSAVQAPATLEDFAYRWPLKTGEENAAWQFALTPEVYAALRDPALADFEVFNGAGQPVPVARLTVDPASQQGVSEVELPTFALPRPSNVGAVEVSLRLERDESGRLRTAQAAFSLPAAAPSPPPSPSPATQGDPANALPPLTTDPAAPVVTYVDYIADADIGRDPRRPASVDRLELRWPTQDGDIRTRFAVEGSEDLNNWETISDAAAVVLLRQGGARIERRHIVFPATTLRYLRLRQLDGDPIRGAKVWARRSRAGVTPPAWQRLRAEYVGTTPDSFGGGHFYRYRLPARLPVGRVGILPGSDNTTAEFTIDAQAGDAAQGEAWVPVGRALAFRLRQGGVAVDSEEHALAVPTAASEWRLRSKAAQNPPPGLEVAFLADRYVFLAQGPGPYTLAAGSRRVRRSEAPVEAALTPLRSRLGADWQPPAATLGAREVAAGESAYADPETPTDWRTWLLWALLVGGAALVAGLALSLLRRRSVEEDAEDAGSTPASAYPEGGSAGVTPVPVARFDAGPARAPVAPAPAAPAAPPPQQPEAKLRESRSVFQEPRMSILRMTDLDLAGKRVLIRQDLNVPVADGAVTSDQRILASLPTLRLALEKGAAVMVMSHLGRPKEGVWSEEDSLAPVARRLGELLGRDVPLVKDWVDGVQVAPGELVLLENCRMNVGEGKDEDALSKKYAALCDVFVMDAFGTAHRAQASTHGVVKFATQACGGPLLMAELDALAKALEHPAKPLLAIVAGSKVSTKLELLSSLVGKVDQLIVGGGIANTFIAAMGYGVGKSLVETDLIDTAKAIMADATARGAQIPIPTDVVVASEFKADAPATVKPVDAVTAEDMILDIGPDTAARYAEMIRAAGTVVWNGPVGVFEFDAFGKGTETLARAIADSRAFSIAGGGDTLAAVDKYGIADEVSYISTGGGAFLEFLEGKTLPAVAALQARAG